MHMVKFFVWFNFILLVSLTVLCSSRLASRTKCVALALSLALDALDLAVALASDVLALALGSGLGRGQEIQ